MASWLSENLNEREEVTSAQGYLGVSPMWMIERLLFRCGPTTVGGLVGAVVINAVNLMFGRGSRPHICNEILKRLPPSGTDGNASPPVTVPLLEVRIGATLLHLEPEGIQWLPLSVKRCVMGIAHLQFCRGLWAACRQASSLILLVGSVCCAATLQASAMKNTQALRAFTRSFTILNGTEQPAGVWRHPTR